MKTNKQNKKQNQNNKKKTINNKKKYLINNWKEYNKSLVNRGNITFWIEDGSENKWYSEILTKQGASRKYSDFAIKLVFQIGQVFGQRLRQSEGLVKSIFKLMNIDLDVPNYTTICRRIGKIAIKIVKNIDVSNDLVFIVDSSGLKVYGEGEWKVRKHGYSKRRTWRKFHLAISPNGEIRASKLTDNNIDDASVVSDLLDQENNPIEKFVGDGAYDKSKVYDVCLKKKIKEFLIPPQKNAKIWQHGNSKKEPHPRDENLRKIRKTNRKKWKIESGYHIRSISENAIFRYKTIFGDKLKSRKNDNQNTEFLMNVNILNKMLELGMPNSYAVG